MRYGNVLGVIELQRTCEICFNVLVNQNDNAVRADITAVYRDLGDVRHYTICHIILEITFLLDFIKLYHRLMYDFQLC